MTALFAGVAVLAYFGWFRTRRFEKVTGPDVAIAVVLGVVLYFFDVSSVAAAVVVALALVVIAPLRAWVPLAVAGVFEVALEPWKQLGHMGTAEFGWFAYEAQQGSQPDWYLGWSTRDGLGSSFSDVETSSRVYATALSLEPGLPVAALVLAVGLLGWAYRRRSLPVALVAVAFGALTFISPGPGLLLLAAAAFAVVPFGRWYPFFAGGVVLLLPVLHDAVLSVGPLIPYEFYGVLTLDQVWLWLAGLLITTGLVVWSLVRKDFVGCVLALAALLVTWPVKPESQSGMQFLSQNQLYVGPTVWPMIFPAVLPALALLVGAFVQWRRKV